MEIIELKDSKRKPDIVHEYSPTISSSHIPLVIDNGSYQCRAGWASSEEPLLTFRNLIAKPRKDRAKKDSVEVLQTPPIQIGNDIVNIEAVRFQLKSQFDRDVVTHYHNQEKILDYIFKHLGIDSVGKIPHPIVMTECFANPNFCRQMMSELLFECYDVPAVCYGVDSLFSFRRNQIGPHGLILSCGYNTTHVIPVLNNVTIASKARRINIGGFHMINFMHRMMQLKYPVHVNAINISRIEALLHNHSSVCVDYTAELKKWATLEFYEEKVKRVQLPFTLPAASTSTVLTPEQKTERRKELAKRLIEINARRREEKLAQEEEEIRRLLDIQELHDSGQMRQFKAALKVNAIASYDELEKLIANVRARVVKLCKQIMCAKNPNDPVQLSEEKLLPTAPQPPAHTNLEDWVLQTKVKRKQILENRQVRRQRKQDLAKRRTAAAQERMRIISQLARKEKGADDFGMRDEDWDVYKAISRETGDSDSEAENEKLIEFEEILRHHDPTFDEPQTIPSCAAEYHQLHFGVEAIRAPELLFQPSMVGSPQAGLAETIEYVLKFFTAEEQLILANNVFLTGGCCQFPGLKERLSKELLEMRPFQTPHRIMVADQPMLDAWFGLRDFAQTDEYHEAEISREDYLEHGGEFLKEHFASNFYFPTPAPIVVEPQQIPASSTTMLLD